MSKGKKGKLREIRIRPTKMARGGHGYQIHAEHEPEEGKNGAMPMPSYHEAQPVTAVGREEALKHAGKLMQEHEGVGAEPDADDETPGRRSLRNAMQD